jgi:hypothetical protein
MPFFSPAVKKQIRALLSLRTKKKRPKRSHQQEEEPLPLIDNPSSKSISLLYEINDNLQSSRAWSPPPSNNGQRNWTSHPFVTWIAEQNEREDDGWLRLGLFQKRTGKMSLVEKVFLERIHAALFVCKNFSSPTGLHKLLNMPMRCAMGVSLKGWKELNLFPNPPDDTESPSRSEDGPDLQEPRNLFENDSQFSQEEEQQEPLEQDGESDLVFFTAEVSKDKFEDTTRDSEKCAASGMREEEQQEPLEQVGESDLVFFTEISEDKLEGFHNRKDSEGMRLCECDGRYFLCRKGFVVQSFACNLQHKNVFFAIPARFDLINKTARSKVANTATINNAKTTALAESMTKLNDVLTRRRFSSKADGDSRRILAGLVMYLPKLSSLALEQVMPFTLYALFNEAGVNINAADLFRSCPSRNSFDRMVKDLSADVLVVSV